MSTTKGRGNYSTTGNSIKFRDTFSNSLTLTTANTSSVSLNFPDNGQDLVSNTNTIFFTNKSFNEIKISNDSDYYTIISQDPTYLSPGEHNLTLKVGNLTSANASFTIGGTSTLDSSTITDSIIPNLTKTGTGKLTLEWGTDDASLGFSSYTTGAEDTIPLFGKPNTFTQINTFEDKIKADVINTLSDANLISKSGSNVNVGTGNDTVVIAGNLTVQGTTTTVNTEQVTIEDPNLQINYGGDDTSAEGAGLTVMGSNNTPLSVFAYDSSLTSKWKIGTDEVVLASASQILTNKTLGSGTTAGNLTGIKNANIAGDAAIARNKIATGSANHVLINNGSGVFSSEAQLAISRGGTGANSREDAFDALSPTTADEDIIIRRGSTHIPLPKGGLGATLAIRGDGKIAWLSSIGANPLNAIGQLIVAESNPLPGETSAPLQPLNPGDANKVLISTGTASIPTYSFLSNTNIASDAAIAGTKISPNFGSQPVFTTSYIQATTFGLGRIPGSTIDVLSNSPAIRLERIDGNNETYLSVGSTTTSFSFGKTLLFKDLSDNTHTVITTDGSVSIGKSTFPSAKLDVAGDIKADGDIFISNSYPVLKLTDTDASGTRQGQLRMSNGVLTLQSQNDGNNGDIRFEGYNGTITEYARFDNQGRFGIGTAPVHRFHVKSEDLGGTVGDEQTVARFVTLTSGNDLTLDVKSRRHTTGTTWTSTETRLEYNVDNVISKTMWMSFYNRDSNTSNNTIRFGEGTSTEWMRIQDGDVGIGTISPSQKLEVNGNVKADSFIAETSTGAVLEINKALSIEDVVPLAATLDLDFSSPDRFDSNITFERNSIATYYDANSTAKAEENLLTYSQDFSNSSWSYANLGAAPTTGHTAPDGTSTAWGFIDNTTNLSHGFFKNDPDIDAIYTLSCYLKQGSKSWAFLRIYDLNAVDRTNYRLAWFNLATGSVGTVETGLAAAISDAGNGWHRCSITTNAPISVTGSGQILISAAEADNDTGYIGNNTVAFYAWGAQLEQRDSVTAYTATTSSPITNYIPVLKTAAANEPRIDFDPITRECKGLLIEEERTNLLDYSEDFSSYNSTGITLIPNSNVSPNGTLTATQLVEDTSTSQKRFYTTINEIPSYTTITWSLYVKANNRQGVTLYPNYGGSGYIVDFDLSTLNVSALLIGTATDGTTTIEDVGNEWYRISVTVTFSSPQTNLNVYGYFSNDNTNGNANYTGDGYSGIYIWGAQLEEGSFPTSYIPTNGAAVTREGDVAKLEGDALSSVINQTEGSFYVEHLDEGPLPASTPTNNFSGLFNLHSISSSFYAFSLTKVDTDLQYSLRIRNPSTSSALTVYNRSPSALNKVAVFYDKANQEAAISSNGASTLSTSDARLPQLNWDVLRIGWSVPLGSDSSNQQPNSHIKRITYWPKKLDAATLQTITSLSDKLPVGGAGGGAGGLIPTAINSATSAKAKFHYLTDTSASSFTVELPSGKKGAAVRFSDAKGTWGSNPLTLTPFSGQKINGYSTDESLLCDVSNGWAQLSWDDVNSLWVVDSSFAATQIEATASSLGVVKKNRWQKKSLPAPNAITSTGTVAALSFSSLEIGKHYQVIMSVRIDAGVTDGYISAEMRNGTDIVAYFIAGSPSPTTSGSNSQGGSGVGIFKATTTTLTFYANSLTDGDIDFADVILIERNDLEDEVSIW